MPEYVASTPAIPGVVRALTFVVATATVSVVHHPINFVAKVKIVVKQAVIVATTALVVHTAKNVAETTHVVKERKHVAEHCVVHQVTYVWVLEGVANPVNLVEVTDCPEGMRCCREPAICC
ncbi:9640_t:CDS:1 [Diversispora eburnea]|uniref:9640_t:CDS:1 n=1 Tax=Diversispora eburnea TaxID=1213867 RepID=A0A9N9C997_9GLOM|nr:9640_t:CDS:1 [Diversispora eburnea]